MFRLFRLAAISSPLSSLLPAGPPGKRERESRRSAPPGLTVSGLKAQRASSPSLACACAAVLLTLAGCSGASVASVSPTQSASSPSIDPAMSSAGPRPSAVPSPASSQSSATVAGPRIAFGRWDAGFDEPLLFTVKPDGTDRRPLLSERAEGPRWSPDGSRLSVIVTSPQGLVFVGVVNRDGSGVQRFDSPDPTLNLGCAVWSHDGTRLACAGWDDADPTRNGIYTVRASDGSDLRRVTTSPGGGFHDEIGDYSPNGTQMVFLRLASGDDHHASVMIADSDGTNARLLLRIDGLTARWSPDGATILTESAGTLILVPAAGGKPSPITIHMTSPAIPVNASRPGWSPDGSHIVFSLRVPDARGTDIYTMRRDGTDVVKVTNSPEDEEFADWGR